MLLRCSICSSLIDSDVGACPSCGLVLGTSDVTRVEDLESDVVVLDEMWSDREPSGREPSHPGFGVFETKEAASITRALDLTGVTGGHRTMGAVVPVRRPEFDVKAARCTPFELYLLSLVDGTTPLSEITAASGLTLIDTVTALTSLHDKGALAFETPGRGTPAPDPAHQPAAVPAAGKGSALGRVALRRGGVAGPARDAADPDFHLGGAERAFNDGDLDLAREHTRLALMAAPNSERGRKLAKALSDPTHAEARAKLLLAHAIHLYQESLHAAAIQLLQGALQEFEGLAPIHHLLSVALIRSQGDLDQAEYHCRRAVALDPVTDVYKRNLIRIRRHLERQEPRTGERLPQ